MTVDSANQVYLGLARTAPTVPGTSNVGMLVKYDTATQSWPPVGGGFHIDEYNNYCGAMFGAIAWPSGITALTASGTDIYAAGFFDVCGSGVTSYHVAKWSAATQTWTALAVDRDWCYFYVLSDVPYINSLLVYSNILYVAGGVDPTCNSSYPQGVAEFPISGPSLGHVVSTASDDLWGPYFSDPYGSGYDVGYGMSLWSINCAVYLTGSFVSTGAAGGMNSIQGIAKKINNGGSWLPLGSGLTYQGSATPAFGQFLTADTNTLYVSGLFDSAGGALATNVAKWFNPAIQAPPPSISAVNA